MGNEMKPLSNDLREKFVHAVLIEGMTCRAAGERFAVSHSAVIKIVRQFVETDAIDPQKVGGSRKPALVKCYDMVRAIVDETPDLTLAQIADEIVARGGPKVGKSTVDRTLARLDLRFKKKPDRRRADADGRRPEARVLPPHRPTLHGFHALHILRRDGGEDQHDAALWPRSRRRATGRLRAARPLEDDDFRGWPEPGRNRRPGRLRPADRRSIVPGLH